MAVLENLFFGVHMETGEHRAIDENKRVVDEWWISILSPLGFETDKPTYPVDPQFDLSDLQDALFAGTFAARATIEVSIEDADRTVSVVVDSVRAVFPDDSDPDRVGRSLGPYPYPDWYVEGHLPIDPLNPEVVLFQMYVRADSSDGSITHEYDSFFQFV